eukprot:2207783-Pleurochrysis_carterae.AAC.4
MVCSPQLTDWRDDGPAGQVRRGWGEGVYHSARVDGQLDVSADIGNSTGVDLDEALVEGWVQPSMYSRLRAGGGGWTGTPVHRAPARRRLTVMVGPHAGSAGSSAGDRTPGRTLRDWAAN